MNLDIKKIKKAYFIGIGGIGMSGLAYWFMKKGKEVCGSDISNTEITKKLENENIKIFYNQDAKHITKDIDCIIYTNAIMKDNPEYTQAQKLKIPMYTYQEALSYMIKDKFVVVISGTHGKTTTTGMIGKIFYDAGLSPTIICGGVMTDFDSNIVIGDSLYVIVEGCEYKRSFLNLTPNILVITNIELDHTDYYKDLPDVQSAFSTLKDSIPNGGYIICDTENNNVIPVISNVKDISIINYKKYLTEDLQLKILGKYNIKNADAAYAVGEVVGIKEDLIKKSLKSFSGIKRRFEYRGKAKNEALLYDDYAHHPTAINEFISSLKGKYPEKKIIIVFQSHLYSRTKDFLLDFKNAFRNADIVVVPPIFPAREKNIYNISHNDIVNVIQSSNTMAFAVNNFEEAAEKALSLSDSNSIIVSLGAGEQYKIIDIISQKMQ